MSFAPYIGQLHYYLYLVSFQGISLIAKGGMPSFAANIWSLDQPTAGMRTKLAKAAGRYRFSN